MARQKHVFPSGQVAHLWAHQSQDNARNAQGNISFDGDKLVSYGHYVIGRICKPSGKQKRNNPLVLIQSDSYSVTTAKQIRGAESATSHMQRVHVPSLVDSCYGHDKDGNSVRIIDHGRNLSHFKREIERIETKIPPSRTNTGWYIEQLNKWIDEGNVYAKFFKLKTHFKSRFSEAEQTALREKSRALCDTQYATRKARYAEKRERARKAEEARIPALNELLDSWLAGNRVDRYALSNATWITKRSTQLRIVGETVETSQGAEFPVKHAILGLALVRRTMAQGVEWRTNGHTCHLGAFKIDYITKDGTVKAGCHVVEWSAIKRIAGQLDALRNEDARRASMTRLAMTNPTPEEQR